MEDSRRSKLRVLTSAYAIAILVAAAMLPSVHADEAAGKSTAQCGNGILEASETCASCPADCAVRACKAAQAQRPVTVRFTAPPERDISGVTVLLAYRSDHLSLPGHGADQSVRERLTETPEQAIVAVNDLDYGMRVVLGRSQPIVSGKLFTVHFDGCGPTAAPTAADVACTVEACATVFGPAQECSCSAAVD